MKRSSSTQLDTALVGALDRADLPRVAGEAGRHCVRATTAHIVANLPGGHLERIVLLTDCMSPVAGFDARQAAFLDGMHAPGVRLAESAERLPELRADAAR